MMESIESGENSTVSNVTDDLTCAACSIQDSPVVVKVYSILDFYSTFIAGSFLNIFLLYLIIRYKKLHTLTFGVSLQIVVLNLLQLYGASIFRLVTVITSKWVFGTGMCAFTGLIIILVYVGRNFLMCDFVIY